MSKFVEVAVPVPVAGALTYAVPPAYRALVRAGQRTRVSVGRRSLIGVITGTRQTPPEGVKVKPLTALLDHEPVLPEELASLAAEAATYYMAPLGELIHMMIPKDLPPWGDRQIWLSNAGALGLARSDTERAILGVLHQEGRVRVSELVESVEAADVPATLLTLQSEGRIVVSEGSRRGARYSAAVELAQGSTDELLERCGRSAPGRQVVSFLAALDRPATIDEVTATVGCTTGVVRRLVKLGVLRQFSQISRIGLDHYRLDPPESAPIVLREDQARAVQSLGGAIDAGKYQAFLLAGVTGSGKTEVYLGAVDRALAVGGSAVILVPEIALVPAIAGLTRARYGEQTAIFHSGLSSSERQQEWERIRHGEARVVVGPRSAVFSPVRDLRLIVVDEEQDPSYKQDSQPRYHGRDIALLRAHRAGAVAALTSATPSLETRHNVEVGKIARLDLTQRVGHGLLPEGVLVDLRQEKTVRRPGEIHFSERLREEIDRVLSAGEQLILLRNRRGYSPLLLCRACGEDSRCEECGLPRTYHLRERRLRCHYCGSTLPVPEVCPACSAEALEPMGSGTERVEEKIREMWPDAGVEVLDRDTARRGEAAAVLERFSRRESQVLVGTQMVSKGHHFPDVVLTAVLLADTYLGFPDFRAVERTYNLLTQVAGRAGRGEKPGQVIIQTYHPEHYAIQAALHHDDEAFVAEEMRFRRVFHYPPYTRMIQLLVRDRNRERAAASIREIGVALSCHPQARELRISGPAPAPFERLRGQWRFQILLRHRSGRLAREVVEEVLRDSPARELIVDVDPYELL